MSFRMFNVTNKDADQFESFGQATPALAMTKMLQDAFRLEETVNIRLYCQVYRRLEFALPPNRFPLLHEAPDSLPHVLTLI